jgi:starch synthase
MWQGSGLTGEGRNMPRKIESSAKTARAGDKKTKQGMNILFVSSEAVPFSKSGGLADVCGALPKALAKRGHDVRVVIPRYWCISRDEGDVGVLLPSMGVPMGGETVWCQVLEGRADGVKYYFVEHQNFFGRSGLYDDGKWEYHDNAERFGFFSRAAIQICKDIGFRPDIMHSNDWQTALVPAYLKIKERDNPFFERTASVFTIHNIAHQGVFPAEKYDFLDLGKDNFNEPRFESWGKVHFMKGAIFYSDAITSVSPTYAEEILAPEGGMGLTPYLERRRSDIYGILNGADYDHWDPAKDPLIPAKYSAKDMSGKAECKACLQKEFGLTQDARIPVIGMVTRLAQQKGLDLVAPVIERIVGDMIVQFAILGSGSKAMEDFFGGLPARYPGSIGAWIGFNNQKAHLIEAGADFFLMPSLFEPCGLNQIYSLKYGTLPIVRRVGGLKDTVEQYDERTGQGTGFLFDKAEAMSVYYTVGWAVSTYYDRPHHMKKMRAEAMKQHFCWDEAASKYEEVYKKALERRATWR